MARLCLRCRKSLHSRSPGHRICNRCKERHADDGLGVGERFA